MSDVVVNGRKARMMAYDMEEFLDSCVKRFHILCDGIINAVNFSFLTTSDWNW